MHKQINIVLNGKGGVGKSFFATNFVQYLKDYQIDHRAVDTDNENSTLKRFHREAEFINIEKVQEIDILFSTLEKCNLVVVDCRAASTDIFLDYFAEVRIFELLEKLSTRLTVVSPINHEADSVQQVKIIAQALGGKCRYVIVKNQAQSEQFRIYDKSNTRNRVGDELAGREILMPRMYDWLVTSLNETNICVTEAMTHSNFSLVDRQRLKNWQSAFYSEITKVLDLLLPDQEPAKGAPKLESKKRGAA